MEAGASGGIAVFSLFAPEDPLDGGDLRIWTLLGGGRATSVYLARKKVDAQGRELRSGLPWECSLPIADGLAAPVVSKWSRSLEGLLHVSPEAASRIRSELAELVRHGASRAWVARTVQAAALLVDLFPELRPAVDLTDSNGLYFLRRFRQLSLLHPLKKMNAAYECVRWNRLEKEIAARSSVLITAGQTDDEHLSSLGATNVRCFGTGTPFVKQPVAAKRLTDDSPRVAFFGGMGWEPNRLAARFLAREVLPHLRRSDPRLSLEIAGAGADRALQDLRGIPGLQLMGHVDDLAGWLSACHVFAMPMVQGAGVKTKLVEAMALGMAVVTNSLGAESLPDEAKRAIVIADGAQGQASAILDLLRSPGKRQGLERTAREAAERYFDPAVLSVAYRRAVLESTHPWAIG